MTDPRQLTAEELPAALDEARAATFAATLDLTDEQWRVPYDPGIQPTAWDLAHVGWFAEFWLLRGPHRIGVDGHVRADRPERQFGPDDDLDSARVSHRARWQMALLPRAELLDRMARQLDDCKRALAAGGTGEVELYHARFALYHELMHHEALLWTRALLGHAAPAGVVMPAVVPGPEVHVPGGEQLVGGPGSAGRFAFDNELPGRKVELRPFAIDAAPVTNGQFLAFVEDGGYRRPEFWPDRAGAWLEARRRTAPERWRRGAHGFEHRWFGTWCPLPAREPVVHVSAFEAEAYCRWAGRRLPTAAEWEVAAPHVRWGNMVWEWTADAFAPYPGFRPAPYHTYSAPWFHHQRELRGGAFTTHRLVHDARYRNFFLPQRTDVFAGFRTAAR
ncbi:MAG TPA: selenoneine synthase SenA [Planctomycetota bacterium]|nr:selenoneine synthase SenA [Planctomycetota bacterium]